MRTILDACTPRDDLLTGNFNPELFTAQLSTVLGKYRGTATVDNIYTDPTAFFQEATYPTAGLRFTLSEVFGRLNGDNSLPAIHRLENAFGGGKTHTLIACTHLAYRGTELAGSAGELVDPRILPNPGEVSVVGVAGDRIPVHSGQGDSLVPRTLWGEMARQIGGEELYREVEAEAGSRAAPGEPFFEAVLGGRKVLIMLDELAQYAARLDAAQPDGADQLAAFLMALHGYARDHSGVSILLTLASAGDAFAKQTERLAKLISEVRGGEDVSEDEALILGERAVKGLKSVVSRDASMVTPVQPAEISSVLAKRLFTRIDREIAKETAEAYDELYQLNRAMLPDEATRPDFRDRMVALYPFHPTFIDFLNRKLSTVENFQGTRGVLRLLARCIRRIWETGAKPAMIHACHLDMRDSGTVGEILSRTGSGDLAMALDADVGGVDTGQLEGGKSNAEIADGKNPHPEGYSLYEYTWKTVFLHSLVGRDQALGSDIFGLTEGQALFQVSFPGISPEMVRQALKEIEHSAYYLRKDQGRFFASLEPSINIILAQIRRTLSHDQTNQLLDATVRKLVKGDSTFEVKHDVSAPENIPDGKGKPILALIRLDAGTIEVETFVTTKGPNNEPRTEQNLVFLLVPETVVTRSPGDGGDDLFSSKGKKAARILADLQDLARFVEAMRILKKNPLQHGIKPARLTEENFEQRYAERENALVTRVSQTYCFLWYPGGTGQVIRRDVRTAGGEGGASNLELIREVLLEDGELIIEEHTGSSHLKSLKELFFEHGDTVSLETIRANFKNLRKWPILERPELLETLVRRGVETGQWCLYRMGDGGSSYPEEFYSRETELAPLNIDFGKEGYSLVTAAGAKQRGWPLEPMIPPLPKPVEEWVKEIVYELNSPATVQQVSEEVRKRYGEVEFEPLNEAVKSLVRGQKLYAFHGPVQPTEKPNPLIGGGNAAQFSPTEADELVSPKVAAERGWLTNPPPPPPPPPPSRGYQLGSTDGARILLSLLRRMGSLYQRGGKNRVDFLELADMKLPEGGRMRLALEDVPPESMKRLDEFFEILADLVDRDDRTLGELEIQEPTEDCPFLKALRDAQGENGNQ